ncbi:G2/mitotic-specific cyclin-B3 isoform X2 [Fukomys damarensis]|uniref:G2/mitotic-specific cyclin-B3 n=1 Tax=Fukomys damarensis TaxID=885580 RepID=A0A091CVM8_FUKDA|nr:G2/mitotic-specific cyclin-B3 isoform X2 [Fukomys damarensis]KFO22637.1 G2/mitotic-specific cyclin-B3 [Fukomys damarensis]
MPLPHQNFKAETKKFQSSKTVPSDRGQSKEMGENYQVKISPSSPQGTFKKRSAFEDLTNAFQYQPVQSKKEDNKEFEKDVPKTINRSKHSLELGRCTERKTKKYKLEVSSVVASTPSVPNVLEKSLLLNVSTNSKTPTTKEVSFAKKPLLLIEEPSTEVTTLQTMSLKKRTIPGETCLLENSLLLQEDTDSDDDFIIQPVTSGKKHKSKEAAITKKTLSLKNICTYPGKQSCLEDVVTLQDSNVDEDSFSVELMNLKKKPKTEKSPPTKNPLSLSGKCTTVEKISRTIKPVKLQKITTENKLVTKEPSAFMRKPTADKESLSCEPSALKEKHNTKQDISIWKKLTLLEETDFEDESLFEELPTFKQSPTMEELTFTPSPVFGRTECTIQRRCTTCGMPSHLKKPVEVQGVISGEESLSPKPSSFKRNPITEFYQEPSASQEKHTTQEEIDLLEEPWTLFEIIDYEASFGTDVVSYNKQQTTMEASHTKKPLPLKKKQKIQRNTNRDNSLIEEPLFFEKFSSDEDSLSQEPSSFEEKGSPEEKMITVRVPRSLQQSRAKKAQSLFRESLAFQKQHNTEKATPSKKPLSLKKQEHTTQGTVSHMKKPLVLQTVTSEEKSPKEPLSLKKKKCTTQATPPRIDLSDWQDIVVKDKNSFFLKPVSSTEKHTPENAVLTKMPSSLKKQTTQRKTTSEEESLCEKLLPFKKKPTTEEEFLSQERSASKEKHTIFQVSLSRKPVALQEKTTTEEESYNKKPVTLKEKPIVEEEFLLQEPFSLHVKPINKDESHFQKAVVLQEKTNTKKKTLVLHKSTMTEESFFSNLSVLTKEPCAEAAASTGRQLPIKNKLTAQEQAFLLKEKLALHEKITNDEGNLIKEPLVLQESVGSEKVLFKEPLTMQEKLGTPKVLFKEPLTMQEKLGTQKETVFKKHTIDIEAHFNQHLDMQEKPSIEKKPNFQEPVNLQEKPTVEEEAIFKKPLALQKKAGLESEAMLKELLALQEKPNTEMETALKEPLTLQEKRSTEKEAILKEPLALQEKSNIEDKVLFQKPLALQKKSTINAPFLFKSMLSLNEKSSTENELSFQELLDLEENLIIKEDIFPETLWILENSPYVSSDAVESSTDKSSASESGSKIPFSPQSRTQKEMTILEDTGKDHDDPFLSSVYAPEIFRYLKDREKNFILKNYMKRQTEITSDMRAILVDWLVEIQMSFNMRHETLYLAMKLVDHYLMKELCRKHKLQLLGSTAFLIAAKFEELLPPCVDDLLYVCDNIYKRHEMIAMELSILKTLNFDINIPVAYNYLRRYALCLNVNMKILTLSRFICELTLQKYDFVHERASKLAAASFLLALYMSNLKNYAPLLEFCSGYMTFELHPLLRKLNVMLTCHYCDKLKTVYNKYSQITFFEVTKIPPLDIATLDEIFAY